MKLGCAYLYNEKLRWIKRLIKFLVADYDFGEAGAVFEIISETFIDGIVKRNFWIGVHKFFVNIDLKDSGDLVIIHFYRAFGVEDFKEAFLLHKLRP